MKRLAIAFAAVCGIVSAAFAASCIVSGSTARPLSGTTAAAPGLLPGALQAVAKTSCNGVLGGRLNACPPSGYYITVR